MPQWMSCNAYVLWVEPDARIVEIRTKEDYMAVLFRYQQQLRWKYTIDYVELSKRYDGLHLTEQGLYNLGQPGWDITYRGKHFVSFYGWDAESTVWFNNVFSRIEPLSKVEHSCRCAK